MADAPRIPDEPMPMKTTKVVEERTYANDPEFRIGVTPEIGGDIKTEETEDPYLNKTRWKNRRRMAWLSLFALIGQVIASMLIIVLTEITVEKMKVLAELMSWPSLAFASVIGAYMGFTTWAGRK